MTSPLRVTVWGENFHENSERDRAGMAERYPEGMHGAIAAGLRELLGDAVEVRTATQDQPEHGLTADVLDNTDVLTWWGHATHGEVDDAVVERVHQRVLGGMGLLVLHSGALLQDLQAADGHHLLAGLAQRRRDRAGLDRGPGPPDRPRRTAARSSSTSRRCTGSTSTSRRPTS